MMKETLTICVLSGLLLFSACESLMDAASKVTYPDPNRNNYSYVVEGLKTALSVSTDTAVNRLNKVNAYFKDETIKILLPPEAQRIMENLARIPLGEEMLNKAIYAVNRAAEDAAIEAAPIFKNAITSITFEDASAILNGEDTAATHYLRKKTFGDLVNTFQPKINNSLSKPLIGNQSAESLYSQLIEQHNKYSFNGKAYPMISDNSLSEYTTRRALQGLFKKVGDEEKKIRNDISHRVTDILRKVFAK